MRYNKKVFFTGCFNIGDAIHQNRLYNVCSDVFQFLGASIDFKVTGEAYGYDAIQQYNLRKRHGYALYSVRINGQRILQISNR